MKTILYEKLFTFSILFVLLIVTILTTRSLTAQPLASGQSKFLGAGSSHFLWRYFDQYWNQITPGNEGKWGVVSPSKDTYNWGNLDKIYNYARNRNLQFKQHTFVWGQQAPGWVASLDSASQRASVEHWIKSFGERYPLTVMADVVNEPFHAVPSYAKGLGGNGKTGWDWVITSFELARKYMPQGCKLILNEYNVLHSNTVTNNYINIINLLKDRNLIDGIGIQGHYFEFRSHIDASSNIYVWNVNTIKSNLDKLAATGIPIYITEFDIDEKDDANQLASYKLYFPIFWSHPAVKGITLWGYISSDVWSAHPTTFLIVDDGSNGIERPALKWLRDYINNPTNVKEAVNIPARFKLEQNYPNPFNPTTRIKYSVSKSAHVSLKVYNLLGQEVSTLFEGNRQPGNYNATFDGSGLASGVYLYKMQSVEFSEAKKLMIIK
ncbi:MAG: xylanase [Ignavibacteria bacterium]|nr:MAG: xylanase [Ignavibacteria bacterium]KAF0160858.1 MAG: xylanase [Ignavibacteria bacterium]